MATIDIPLASGVVFNCFDHRRHALHFLPSKSRWVFRNFAEFSRKPYGSFRRRMTTFVCCQTPAKTEELQKRKCSPLLECEVLSNRVVWGSSNWEAVPDIWRTTAEKYGNQIAVVDPYHDPSLQLSYKQLQSHMRAMDKRRNLWRYSVQWLKQEILDFCEGLRVVGIMPDEKLALFADNSCRWLIADQGGMAMGAVNVVRGSRSSTQELWQIYSHSESVALIVDNPQLLNRIADLFIAKATMKLVILLWGDKSELSREVLDKVSVFHYQEIIEMGKHSRELLIDSYDARKLYDYEPIRSGDVATLIYTSGTTGNPKAVMITHHNLLHQIKSLWDIIPVKAGDRFLSMLPPWHAYERVLEYFTFAYGAGQVYTDVKSLKEDLRKYQPDYLISVPLIYETLYSAIQKEIVASSAFQRIMALASLKISLMYMELKRIYEGKYLSRKHKQPSYPIAIMDWLWARVAAAILRPIHALARKLLYSKFQSTIGIPKAGVSAGGSLPIHVNKFFEAIGILLQNGYGLTESTAAIAARRPTYDILGSIGHPVLHTEIKVVDADTNEILPPGSKGIIKARGPQVMRGYYKNPDATRQVLDDDGWLDTGDLGWIAPCHSAGRSRLCGGVLVHEGRAKHTIVLSTGENVEPSELEDAAMRSSLIQQIVVIGQDQRRLGAIIFPNKEEVLKAAKTLSILDADADELGSETLTNLLRQELTTWTSECPFRIGPILIVDEPLHNREWSDDSNHEDSKRAGGWEI